MNSPNPSNFQVSIPDIFNRSKTGFLQFRQFQNQHAAHFDPDKLKAFDVLWNAYEKAVNAVIENGATSQSAQLLMQACRAINRMAGYESTPQMELSKEDAHQYEHLRHKMRGFVEMAACIERIEKSLRPRTLP
ncbi:MAG: hypothetical protein KGJ06_08345 [Pseudomonadota bacterium]|nr:hypothetical protein [Pseudomonadota bacterium]